MTKALIDLMNRMGYSVAIPGNHEFDYGMDNFLSLADKAQFKYISCNFQYKGKMCLTPMSSVRSAAERSLLSG